MRYELSDYEWTAIKPMLPNKPRGVRRVNDRRVLNGIFWVLRSGAPWRDLPECESARSRDPTRINQIRYLPRRFGVGTPGRNKSVPRVSAPNIEAAVIAATRKHLAKHKTGMSDREFLEAHVSRVIVGNDNLTIEFCRDPKRQQPEDATSTEDRPDHLSIPWTHNSARPEIEIDETAAKATPAPDPTLVQAVARAHDWLRSLMDGTHNSIEELAKANGMNPKAVRAAIRMAFLAPDITAAVLNGDQLRSFRLAKMNSNLPLAWSEQCLIISNTVG